MATPTVVLLPVWGVGHLMSMLDAGKRLLARSGGALSLTVLVMQAPTESYRAEVAGHIRREEASGLGIRFQHLPAVEPPTDHVGVEEFVSRFVQLHAAHVRAAVSGLTCPVAALVLDFFGTTLLDVSRDLAVPAYVYFTASAAMYALFLRLPALQEEVAVEFEEMEGTVDVPGLPPVPPSSLPSPVMDKKHPNYAWFVYHGRRFMEAKGVIINTAAELETSVLAAIADGRCTRGIPAPTVYPVGPVLSLNPPAERPHECVAWLDAQPPASVVLLCFGSGGFSAAPQAHETARGLERSGHRFLWVPPRPAGGRHPTSLGRHGGGLRDARRVELDPGGGVVRGAHGAVAALRGAAPERVHAGRLHGRGAGHGGGQEEEQLGRRVGAGAGREGAHGRRLRRGEEGEGEGHGDEERVQEGRRRGRVLVLCTGEARRGDDQWRE